jgi:hypothetical protein
MAESNPGRRPLPRSRARAGAASLAGPAADRVWTSRAMILPLRTAGASGSAIRPVAIGVPGQR